MNGCRFEGGGGGEGAIEDAGDGGEVLHQLGEGVGEKGLRAVAHGLGGAVVAFDHDAVGTGGNGGAGEGGDVLAIAGGVGRIDDDRQVRELLDDGNGGHVERVAKR